MNVTIDGTDNSIIFGDELVELLNFFDGRLPHIFVFWIPELERFGFEVVSMSRAATIPAPQVQYNPIYELYGIGTINPTANYMLYKWGEDADVVAAPVYATRVHGRKIYVIDYGK